MCGNCGAVLDAQDPDARLIARVEQTKVTPLIPLGARGRFESAPFEVIGYLVRRTVGEEVYTWFELLLYNPTLGFRWLVNYHGHWTLLKAAPGVPSVSGRSAEYLGQKYSHFSTATAEVAAVAGEFPWQVKVGERTLVEDWVAPPRTLSRERNEQETTWSVGEYVDGAAVWKAFGLPGAPPERIGVGACQPSPYAGRGGRVARLLLGFAVAAIALHLLFVMFSQQKLALDLTGEYQPKTPDAATVVSEPFTLGGRTSNVRLDVSTTVANSWVYVNFALINDVTGVARSFGREVSYYSGRDSDGSWTEGSNWDRVYLPSVPAGTYLLVVEPEGPYAVAWRVRLTRDVPRPLWLWLALGLLTMPAVAMWIAHLRFEGRRWSESDHSGSSGGGSSSDD
ncbi:MAG TPA: DUF4178 domain-containing protein [Methylomirabilota bacterium]|nr:DUF4178 domain-containing protein [Methylomirabilota bacterium]